MGLMWPITWTDTLTPLVPLCCMRWAPHTWPLTQACITLALWNGAGYGGRVGGALASMTVGWTSLTSALPLVPSSPPIPHAPGDVCCANDVQVCVCVGAFVEYMTKSSAWPRSLVAPTATHAAFLLHAARSAHRVCMTLGWCQADQMLSDRGSARVRPFVSSFLFFFIILRRKKKKRSCVITQRGCCYGIVGQPQSSARHIAAFSIHTHTIHVAACHLLPLGGRETRVGSCSFACGGGFDSP
jgi:hypothetical protein